MFTGLIAATGTVLDLKAGNGTPRLTVSLPREMAEQLSEGGSIAVNGVCLTALEISHDRFSADLAAETLARTTLARLLAGATVNLELPTAAGAPLGGHIVQGHVDGVGRVASLAPATGNGGDWDLRVLVPRALAAVLLPQGSIALDGISLTIAEIENVGEEVLVRAAIIPHTYQMTNLRTLSTGSAVNIETDILANYAARRSTHPPREITLEYLLSNGY